MVLEKRPVYCFELEKTFESCGDAARYFNVSTTNVVAHFQGMTHTLRGMHLCYEEEKYEKAIEMLYRKPKVARTPVTLVANDGTHRIHYASIASAAKAIGVNRSTVRDALRSGKPIHGYFVKHGCEKED